MRAMRKAPEIVVRNGKPAAVIIDIEAYRGILERLEDAEDIKALDEARKGSLSFRSLDDFLREASEAV
jgi:prevent-host-death family protein